MNKLIATSPIFILVGAMIFLAEIIEDPTKDKVEIMQVPSNSIPDNPIPDNPVPDNSIPDIPVPDNPILDNPI